MNPASSSYVENYFCHNKFVGALLGTIDALGSFFYHNKKAKRLPTKVHKILLCRNDHLGDVLMLTPIISALREHFNEAEIHLVVASGSRPLLPHISGIARFHYFDISILNRENKAGIYKIGKMICQIPKFILTLRKNAFDIGIDFRPHLGNLLPLLGLCNIKYLIGYKTGGFGFFCNQTIIFNQNRHFIENMFDCIQPLIPDVDPKKYPIRLFLSEKSSKALIYNKKTLPSHYIIVHPFAGNPAKYWPLNKWNQLIKLMLENQACSIVLLGGHAEIHYIYEIIPKITPQCIDLVGQTSIPDLIGIIKGCDLFIGLDSLLIHIAAAYRKPCVIIHGGIENSEQWKPWLTESSLFTSPINCAPCRLKNGCDKMKCINDITVESIFTAFKTYFKSRRS